MIGGELIVVETGREDLICSGIGSVRWRFS
jgi:hypothetical protein